METRKREGKMEDSLILEMRSYLNDIANGRSRSQLEDLILNGLKLIHLEKGIFRCKLFIDERVSREDGVWETGAIAGVIDVISYAAVYSLGDGVYTTLSLNSSFYSTAKIQEEVEIEGKVTETKGNLKQVITEIRREGNGQVIARGSIWMVSLGQGLRLKDMPPSLSKSNL